MGENAETHAKEGIAVEETTCEEVSGQVEESIDLEEAELKLEADDEVAIESLDETEEENAAEVLSGGGLGHPGGGWGGAQAPVNRAQRVGTRRGLQVTSRKRTNANPGSDHHPNQRTSDAVDLSNGSSPTPQMDATAARIAALLGHPGWTGGVLEVHSNGYRVQLLYKTNVGGNHFNHVHVGVRMQ